MQKTKWLSEQALQIAMKRREVKSKVEKERYTHLNAEVQRTARTNKKAFLSDQCKEIEENNRMGKTRDLFKKIRDTMGTFHAKMGSIKDRNGRDLTEAEDIKRWQKMMLWKCCTQYASKFGRLSSGHRTGKSQFSFQSKMETMPKNVQTTAQLHSSHMLVK